MVDHKQFVGKLSRPRLKNVVARTRLFHVLDRACKAPIVWIAAPAGFGKTTLVASYLDARDLKHLWYQADARDQDPATFFYYLREAVRQLAPRKRETLPLLTPEYLHGLPVFTRNFFEQVFARLKRPVVLVIDNYQDVTANASLHQLLPEGLSHIPDGVTVLILSRSIPPAAFTRLQVQRSLRVVDAGSLALTLPEARAIARLYRVSTLTPETLKSLHDRVQGWIAGWMLLLERAQKDKLTEADIPPGACEAVFDYIAAELFNRVEPEIQDLLMQCALLPQVSAAMAQSLTSEERAEAVLAGLVRKGYFTTRVGGGTPYYQFHPLFREFLRERGRARFSVDEYRRLTQRAAAVLIAAGQPDQAADLLRDCRNETGLIDLILAQAPALAAQGRIRTVEGWLAALPRAAIESNPWLLYWSGVCRLPFNPRESREHFESAFERLVAQGDRAGAMFAWAGVVDTFIYEWGHFKPLDRWIEIMERILEADASFPSAEVAARVASGMFMALMYRRPDHQKMAQWVAQVRTLVIESTDVRAQMLLGNQLLLYYTSWVGDIAAARQVLDAVRPPPATADTAPLAYIAWCSMEAGYCWFMADYKECLRVVNNGLTTAERSGVALMSALLISQGVMGALTAGDFQTAERLLGMAVARNSDASLLDRAHYCYMVFLNALHRGNVAGSIEYARRAVDLSDAAGVPFAQALHRLALAQALFDQGARLEALACLAEARRIGRGMRSANIEFGAQFSLVLFALDQGKNKFAVSLLRKALALARERGYTNRPLWTRKVMVRLFTTAIENDIEVEFVQRLIRERQLLPEGPALTNPLWPWPLKIYTLGGFRIEKDDAPMCFSGKVQRRPLDLLKIVIALGGREVDTQRIIDELWPEAEGDAAADALATALRRLRLLLGNPAALVLQDNKLTIDPRRVWVDAWTLEHLFDRGNDAPADFARILVLYQGAFLEKDADVTWAWPLRERLRNRFLRELAKQCHVLMQARQYKEAIHLTEKGLDVDSLAEELYGNLIRCHQALGQRAEALGAYERCRKILSSTLGVAPSPETEALYQGLRKI